MSDKEKCAKFEEVLKKYNFYRDDFINMVAYYILDKGFSVVNEMSDKDVNEMYDELVADEKRKEEEAKKTGKRTFSMLTPEFQRDLVACASEIVKVGDIGDTMTFLMRFTCHRGLQNAEWEYTNPDRYRIYEHGRSFIVGDEETGNNVRSFKSREDAEDFIERLSDMSEGEARSYVTHKEDNFSYSGIFDYLDEEYEEPSKDKGEYER